VAHDEALVAIGAEDVALEGARPRLGTFRNSGPVGETELRSERPRQRVSGVRKRGERLDDVVSESGRLSLPRRRRTERQICVSSRARATTGLQNGDLAEPGTGEDKKATKPDGSRMPEQE